MIFNTYLLNGDLVIELDEEGIEYLEAGLAQLTEDGPGCTLSTPAFETENGIPISASNTYLRHYDPEEPPFDPGHYIDAPEED